MQTTIMSTKSIPLPIWEECHDRAQRNRPSMLDNGVVFVINLNKKYWIARTSKLIGECTKTLAVSSSIISQRFVRATLIMINISDVTIRSHRHTRFAVRPKKCNERTSLQYDGRSGYNLTKFNHFSDRVENFNSFKSSADSLITPKKLVSRT